MEYGDNDLLFMISREKSTSSLNNIFTNVPTDIATMCATVQGELHICDNQAK